MVSLPRLAAVALLLLACACARPPAEDRAALAAAVADEGGLRPLRLPAGNFVLAAWVRGAAPSGDLSVYIEGDGAAWASRRRLSADPTPTDPLALRLAARDPAPAVAALARPCHYTGALTSEPCRDARWWSDARLAEPAVAAMDQAVDALKRQAGAARLHLIGFSGGGGMAALLAARRDDVASLRTVAGTLDHAAHSAHHGVSPWASSLNPVDQAQRLTGLAQVHFVGRADSVMPPFIARRFAARVGACARVVEVEATHAAGWVERWPALLADAPSCHH